MSLVAEDNDPVGVLDEDALAEAVELRKVVALAR
jgi:hypothetical protein